MSPLNVSHPRARSSASGSIGVTSGTAMRPERPAGPKASTTAISARGRPGVAPKIRPTHGLVPPPMNRTRRTKRTPVPRTRRRRGSPGVDHVSDPIRTRGAADGPPLPSARSRRCVARRLFRDQPSSIGTVAGWSEAGSADRQPMISPDIGAFTGGLAGDRQLRSPVPAGALREFRVRCHGLLGPVSTTHERPCVRPSRDFCPPRT